VTEETSGGPQQQPFPILPVIIVAGAAVALALVAVVAMAAMMASHDGMMGGSRSALPKPTVLDETAVTVDIRDFDYEPRSISIPAGTEVTWTNRDSAPHTATDEDETWDTGTLKKGGAGSVTFDSPGEYPYYCTLHPYMTGLVVVR
jgi:plastocyanin